MPGSGSHGVEWTLRPYPERWWRRSFRRTVARSTVRAADGHTYLVRAVRVPEGRESPVLDVASGLAGAVLPGLGGHLADLAGWVPIIRMRWGVRVLRRSSRFRPAQLVYGGEELATADQSVKRALVLAHLLETAEPDIKRAFVLERRIATPPPKRRA